MNIDLEQIKGNDKFHGKNSGFVDLGFVKTCDELVIDPCFELTWIIPPGDWLKNTCTLWIQISMNGKLTFCSMTPLNWARMMKMSKFATIL